MAEIELKLTLQWLLAVTGVGACWWTEHCESVPVQYVEVGPVVGEGWRYG